MVTLLLLAEHILHFLLTNREDKTKMIAKFSTMIDSSLQTTGCGIVEFYPQFNVKKTPVFTKLPDSLCIKIVEVNNAQWKKSFQDLQAQLYANTSCSPK